MKAKFVYESVFAPKSDEEISNHLKNLSGYERTEMLKKAIVKDDKFLIKKLLNFIDINEFNRDARNYGYEEFRPDNINLIITKMASRDKTGELLKMFIDKGFVPMTRNLNVDWDIRQHLEEILKENIQYEELIKLLNDRLYNELLNEKIKVSYDQQFRKANHNNFTKDELLDMVTKQMKYAFDALSIPMLNLQIQDSREMDPVMWTSEHDHPTWEIYSTSPIILNGFEAKRLHSNFENLANKDNQQKKHRDEKTVYLKVNDYILRRRDHGLYFDKGSSYDSKKLNLLIL